jgi:Holliday junction DNA helicase RuvA
MIDRLTGTVLSRGPTEVVLDVNGVGYRLEISLATSDELAHRPSGARVTLLTHLHLTVNNDPSLRLFGFATEDERRLFRLLLPIKGVGPLTALRLLSSGRTVAEVERAIASGDPKRIKAKGVGPKIAERVAIELKGKVGLPAAGVVARPALGAAPVAGAWDEAFLALRGLEFEEDEARKLLDAASRALGEGASVEELVREGLRSAS